jgi:putative addiction module killer protein
MKSRVQIAKRLEKIETEGHFGTTREDLGDGVCELKWKNGRRIYYAYIPKDNVLLLVGGNKNGQDKDITQAKKILRENIENEA